MTSFRAEALIEDKLREMGWNVIHTNQGKSSGIFNLTAMRDNVSIPIYIRSLSTIEDGDPSLSKIVAITAKDFVENGNDVVICLLTRRGVSATIVTNNSDIENMFRETKAVVEEDVSRHAPLELLVDRFVKHYEDKLSPKLMAEV